MTRDLALITSIKDPVVLNSRDFILPSVKIVIYSVVYLHHSNKYSGVAVSMKNKDIFQCLLTFRTKAW